MNERALRTVLLVQAIEETDPAGDVLPLADRVEATRSIVGNGPVPPEGPTPGPLSSATEWFLTRRADALLEKLRTRSPGLDHVLAIAGGVTWLDRALLVLAFVSGAGLAFFDGNHRLNIFAYPLLCLLLWNLPVYVLLVSRALRQEPDGKRGGFWFGNFFANGVRGQIDALLGHSTRFNAPLAPGLRRFAADWWEIAHPLFVLRARRLLHLGAALFALGLVAGFYVEGFLLHYPAGWDSAFLGPPSAHALLLILYGPASLISGIPLPSSEEIAALRWMGPTGGGGDPAQWVHLIAWSAVLYIVLPRLFAALVATVALWRRSRKLPTPEGISNYARTLFAAMEK